MADAIRIEEVSFRYGAADVVRGVTLSAAPGEFLSLLGPSGCGKTTLLKLVGGYLEPERGRIWISGREMTRIPPQSRQIGMVFQNYALFPHLTARRNVAFGLEVRGEPAVTTALRVEEMLDRVRLETAVRDRLPAELSGGQQQRVALARALAFSPRLLLLDEPFASLDRHLREQLRGELRRIHQESGVTTLLVTHDQEEALGISDRIAVMRDGRLLQEGTPRDLYERPRGEFVAGFLGEANIVSGDLLHRSPDRRFLVRPEQIRLEGDRVGKVRSVCYQGATALLEIETDQVVWKVRTPATVRIRPGEAVGLALPDDPWECSGAAHEGSDA